ncbi:unnamed protein product [Alternaria alternata]
MDPVSLALTVIGLPAALTMTFKSLRKIVESIKYAKRELRDLEEEVDLFAGIFDSFLDACDEASLETEGASIIKRHLRSWTEKVMEGFENLLERVQAVGRDPRYEHSTIEVITAHYRWIMSKSTLRYLRACLNVARQSMIAFTNIRVLGKLNEELAYLQSALTSTAERQSIELRHGVRLEDRIQIVQMKTYNRRMQRHKIDNRLYEGIDRVRAYEEKNIDHDLVPQEKTLLQFQRSVDRFVDQIVFQEKSDRKARRTQDSSSVLTSDSSATTPTQSTQPSDDPRQAPESPPTSPEPSIANTPIIEIQPEAEQTNSILNFCERCSGTCTNTEAHNTSIRPSTPDPLPQTVWHYSSTQSSEAKRIRTSSRPQSQPTSQTQPSSPNPMPASRLRTDSRQNYPPKPSAEPVEEDSETSHVDPVTLGEDEDDPEDGISEEGVSAKEQVTGSKPSMWKAVSGQEGDMPRALRILRENRSR